MTVRWMTPNSSSGAGVAGDAVLRQGMREEDGSGWEGDRLRLGHVETPGCRQDVGSGALGRGLGGPASPRCVSAARVPGVGELAQESRWKGRAPGLENRHI